MISFIFVSKIDFRSKSWSQNWFYTWLNFMALPAFSNIFEDRLSWFLEHKFVTNRHNLKIIFEILKNLLSVRIWKVMSFWWTCQDCYHIFGFKNLCQFYATLFFMSRILIPVENQFGRKRLFLEFSYYRVGCKSRQKT